MLTCLADVQAPFCLAGPLAAPCCHEIGEFVKLSTTSVLYPPWPALVCGLGVGLALTNPVDVLLEIQLSDKMFEGLFR